jgi:hypothetical protein
MYSTILTPVFLLKRHGEHVTYINVARLGKIKYMQSNHSLGTTVMAYTHCPGKSVQHYFNYNNVTHKLTLFLAQLRLNVYSVLPYLTTTAW